MITDAKATGEFEGSVEDIRATSIKLLAAPEVIATDASCGAVTELTKLVLDRGISLDTTVQSIIDESGGIDKPNDSSNEPMSDEEEDDDEDDEHCKSGFYMSRRKIAGRHLIMFASRKVEQQEGVDADFIDPLRLMVITRPNTGKNPCEMPSEEMRYKYRLLVSSDDLLQHIEKVKNGDPTSDDEDKDEEESEEDGSQPLDAASIVRRSKYRSTVVDMWDDAYDNSNFDVHNDGLAPRVSNIGLITGAVLHILPSLEKAVQFLPTSQRSLRVMRVEVSDSGQRIVGIKFPISEEAIARLMTGMKEVADARSMSMDSTSYVDEPYLQIDEKARAYATTERKTMKSFFSAVSSSSSSSKASSKASGSSIGGTLGSKRKVTMTPAGSEKKQKSNSSKEPAKKKISSFFGQKGSY